MATIGEIQNLAILKTVDFGVYLDGGCLGEILLPRLQVPPRCELGNRVQVFLYHDTENRLIATTSMPKAALGQGACMAVRAVNEVGAFCEWGIPKDLFVPFAQQKTPMKVGESYLIYVFMDQVSGRITGSSKLERFLTKRPEGLVDGQQVDLLIGEKTHKGWLAVISHTALGFIYDSDIFQEIRIGQKVVGFVKHLREDGKVDLCLQKPGYDKVPDIAERVFVEIRSRGGFLPMTDKSPAQEILRVFRVSKKTFKMAVGSLFKSRRIVLHNDGISLALSNDIDHHASFSQRLA